MVFHLTALWASDGVLRCVQHYLAQGADPGKIGQNYSALDWAQWSLGTCWNASTPVRNEKRAKTDQAQFQCLKGSESDRRGASTKPSCDACEKRQDSQVLLRSEGIGPRKRSLKIIDSTSTPAGGLSQRISEAGLGFMKRLARGIFRK